MHKNINWGLFIKLQTIKFMLNEAKIDINSI